MSARWLDWAQRLNAIAQSGLNYDPRPFDRQRFEQLREIAAEIIGAHTEVQPEVVRDVLATDAGHATPKVDSRGIVFRGDQILLVQEMLDHNRWTLPGGWVDVGEPPSRAVEREVWEESGYQVRAVKLLALYDRNLHGHPPGIFHAYKMFFLCELQSEVRNEGPNLETSGVGFFSLDHLPELSLARVTPTQIARFFEHRAHPEWPTDFD